MVHNNPFLDDKPNKLTKKDEERKKKRIEENEEKDGGYRGGIGPQSPDLDEPEPKK